MRDIHQQILLLERLDHGGQHHRYNLQRRRGDGRLCDEDAGVEIMLVDVLRKRTHLLHPNTELRAEFDPDCACGWRRWVGVGWCG